MGEFIGISITLLERQIEWMEDQDWITNRSQFIRELIEMAREGRSYRQIEKRTKVRPKPEMKTKRSLIKRRRICKNSVMRSSNQSCSNVARK